MEVLEGTYGRVLWDGVKGVGSGGRFWDGIL